VEHKLRVFEKKVMGRLFGTRRDEMTGEWKTFCLWLYMGVKLGL
jgi:hypothetical protein